MKIAQYINQELRDGRNLLAFSGGVDSSALYFLLRKSGISFDVAMVDYGLRKQSELEVSYAKMLCFLDSKKFFLHKEPYFKSDFENTARKVRYAFFEKIIKKEGYTHLILAHQLNDALEWFLMQFTKGTSIYNCAMQDFYQKKNGVSYVLVRPLLEVCRDEIVEYLRQNKIFYFEDYSNFSFAHKRNYFRQNFSNILMRDFKSGIAFTLKNLRENALESLLQEMDIFTLECGEICVFKGVDVILLEQIHRACKMCGVLLSKRELGEIKKVESKDFSMIFKHKISIERSRELIFIAHLKGDRKDIIPKNVRENYRVLKIPKYFRVALYRAKNQNKEQEILRVIQKLIQDKKRDSV